MTSKVSVVKCLDYHPASVFEATKKALENLGGISNFIKPKSKVLVKPNLLMAKEPQFAITTHPEVVRSVIRLLKEVDAKIIVGDGPSVWDGHSENVDEVYERTGVRKVCDEEDVELIKFDRRRWRKKFPLTTRLDECDHLVNVPKFKTHTLTTLTAAIKNLFGLVSDTFKTELHKNYFGKEDFAKIIVDIFEEAKPSLTIVDAVESLHGDGPATSGKIRNTGLILAGSDAVAIDSILALIMGLEPKDILTNKEAGQRGLGVTDKKAIEILGEKLEDITGRPFELPATSMFNSRVPRPIINIAKKLIKYYPCVEEDNCIKCAACIDICPNEAIRIKGKKLVFDYSKCISCFCCQENCPNAAIKVRKSLLARIIGL